MPKFIYAFHGGSKPETPEEGVRVMAAWQTWLEALGSVVVDPGHPAGMSKTVTQEGIIDNGGSNPISGYTLVRVETMEAALELTKGCPIFESGGTVEVAEAVEM